MKTTAILPLLLMLCSLSSGSSWARETRSAGGGHSGFDRSHGDRPRFGGDHRDHRYFGGGHHNSNTHFGVYFGVPFYRYPHPYYRPYYRPFYHPYYSYPYYYPPAVVTVPATPPVYIQQSPPTTQNYPSGYWYYCNSPEGYYPYVKQCPSGWQQVEANPPAPR